MVGEVNGKVSTHSRPKAAGPLHDGYIREDICFNTQPPEGGWVIATTWDGINKGFNTQPPEGGWICSCCPFFSDSMFQHTAARRRLVDLAVGDKIIFRVSTHSRPKAAGSLSGACF